MTTTEYEAFKDLLINSTEKLHKRISNFSSKVDTKFDTLNDRVSGLKTDIAVTTSNVPTDEDIKKEVKTQILEERAKMVVKTVTSAPVNKERLVYISTIVTGVVYIMKESGLFS